MKKVSIYSLLFALLALNPLPIKADTSKALALVGATGLGIVSYGSFVFGFENFDKAREYSVYAEQNYPSAYSPTQGESIKQSFIAEKKSALNYGKIFLISGLASLLGVGYLTYKAL